MQNSCHPILAHLAPTKVVPNPIYCCPGMQFQIVTGVNQVIQVRVKPGLLIDVPQSGKSSYLHQIGLLQIIAQLGCFVPAEFAAMRLFKRLVLSSPSKDDIFNNTSTFMDEMNTMSSICVDDDLAMFQETLMLIDELGRGTGIQDSLAINIALCEYILKRLEDSDMNPFVFMTTWLSPLITHLENFPNVVFYHLTTEVPAVFIIKQLLH